MKKFLALIFLALGSPSVAKAETCEKWIQAANVFEEFENGEVKERHSLFALNDWTTNGEFDFLVIPKANAEDLTYDLQFFEPKKKTMNTPLMFSEDFASDKSYRAIATEQIAVFKNEKSKATHYRVRIQQKGKELCLSQKFSINREVE